ncbi:MAG TPA: YhjD/YihY/BrkB family envelope integrity protein [Mycobacteriales bacterium]|nr:YhjD/YihY/BrkB family envelope integrity protein [Mycobacteriales bacterium]
MRRVLGAYSSDNGSDLAALLTYYGFLAVLPMLLAAVTLLAMLLPGHPELRNRVLESSLVQFPVVGDELRASVHEQPGIAGLVTGLVVGFLGARGFCLVLQRSVDAIWAVPVKMRPSWLRRELRTLSLIGVIGAGALVTSALAAAAGSSLLRLLLLALVLPATAALLLAALRVVAPDAVPTRDLVIAAASASVGLVVLQVVGSRLVVYLTESQSKYGDFALVLGLLAWIYLQARLLVLALEIGKLAGGKALTDGAGSPPPPGPPDPARASSLAGARG